MNQTFCSVTRWARRSGQTRQPYGAHQSRLTSLALYTLSGITLTTNEHTISKSAPARHVSMPSKPVSVTSKLQHTGGPGGPGAPVSIGMTSFPDQLIPGGPGKPTGPVLPLSPESNTCMLLIGFFQRYKWSLLCLYFCEKRVTSGKDRW